MHAERVQEGSEVPAHLRRATCRARHHQAALRLPWAGIRQAFGLKANSASRSIAEPAGINRSLRFCARIVFAADCEPTPREAACRPGGQSHAASGSQQKSGDAIGSRAVHRSSRRRPDPGGTVRPRTPGESRRICWAVGCNERGSKKASRCSAVSVGTPSRSPVAMRLALPIVSVRAWERRRSGCWTTITSFAL